LSGWTRSGEIIAGAKKSGKQKETTESKPGLKLGLFGFVLGSFLQIAQFDLFSYPFVM
jgi:hypothetical protein